jgi:hypothetical protein
MVKNWRSMVLVVAAAILASCDPAVRIEGRVLRGDGAAVGSARVEVTCPKRGYALNKPITTDMTGRFDETGLGCIRKSCEIRVITPDGATAVERVGDHCVYTDWYCKSASCNHIKVDLVLPRTGAVPP